MFFLLLNFYFIERMPISQIDFPTENFSRIDRFKDPYSDLDSRYGLRATEIFWKDESTYLQWNHDPFYYGIFFINFLRIFS